TPPRYAALYITPSSRHQFSRIAPRGVARHNDETPPKLSLDAPIFRGTRHPRPQASGRLIARHGLVLPLKTRNYLRGYGVRAQTTPPSQRRRTCQFTPTDRNGRDGDVG